MFFIHLKIRNHVFYTFQGIKKNWSQQNQENPVFTTSGGSKKMSLLLPQEVVKKYPDPNSNLKKNLLPVPKHDTGSNGHYDSHTSHVH